MAGTSKRFEAGVTRAVIGPGGCTWDVTGWVAAKFAIQTPPSGWVTLRRGLGVAGVRFARVWATSSGELDWSTLESTRA